MGSKTQTGIFLMIIGFGLAIISILVREACLTSILGLVMLILAIIGILYIFLDRKSFSERHQKFAKYSLVLYILAAVLVVILVFITARALADILVASGDQSVPRDAVINLFSAMKDILYLGIIIDVIYAIGRTLLVHELEDKSGQTILYAAFIATILLTLIATVVGLTLIDSAILSIADQTTISIEEFTILSEELAVLNIYQYLAVIPAILYMIAYYFAYNNLERIAGEQAAMRIALAKETEGETERPVSETEEMAEIPVTAGELICKNCGSTKMLACRDGTTVCEDCGKVFKNMISSNQNTDN